MDGSLSDGVRILPNGSDLNGSVVQNVEEDTGRDRSGLAQSAFDHGVDNIDLLLFDSSTGEFFDPLGEDGLAGNEDVEFVDLLNGAQDSLLLPPEGDDDESPPNGELSLLGDPLGTQLSAAL